MGAGNVHTWCMEELQLLQLKAPSQGSKKHTDCCCCNLEHHTTGYAAMLSKEFKKPLWRSKAEAFESVRSQQVLTRKTSCLHLGQIAGRWGIVHHNIPDHVASQPHSWHHCCWCWRCSWITISIRFPLDLFSLENLFLKPHLDVRIRSKALHRGNNWNCQRIGIASQSSQSHNALERKLPIETQSPKAIHGNQVHGSIPQQNPRILCFWPKQMLKNANALWFISHN